jgi:hypothetical protein
MHKKATAILSEEIGPCGTQGVMQQKARTAMKLRQFNQKSILWAKAGELHCQCEVLEFVLYECKHHLPITIRRDLHLEEPLHTTPTLPPLDPFYSKPKRMISIGRSSTAVIRGRPTLCV